MSAGRARLAMQIAGRGRLEDHPPGVVDGARFEGRFVIYSLNGADGPVFGADVSLFDGEMVKTRGRGPQSAHFVAVRSGYVLEGFVTGDDSIEGHTIGRTAACTTLRVYFDAAPSGERSFRDRASWFSGHLVATYAAEEYFQIDARAEIFDTRVNYSLLSSEPFQFNGVTVDLAELAPSMVELSHGHLPEPDPQPEPVPDEEPFGGFGPGTFANHFPVGGAIIAS